MDRYNILFRQAMIGRSLKEEVTSKSRTGRPMLSLWGEDAGFSGADIHSNRAYRIYLDYDENLKIHDLQIVIEGELISPCSGYRYEMLDEFDYEPILNWCLKYTKN